MLNYISFSAIFLTYCFTYLQRNCYNSIVVISFRICLLLIKKLKLSSYQQFDFNILPFSREIGFPLSSSLLILLSWTASKICSNSSYKPCKTTVLNNVQAISASSLATACNRPSSVPPVIAYSSAYSSTSSFITLIRSSCNSCGIRKVGLSFMYSPYDL